MYRLFCLWFTCSLMGSFVTFGGFFAAPSEVKSPCSSTNQFARCLACTERYEQEVASLLKAGSALSASSPYSENSPSLRMAEIEAGKAVDVMKVCNPFVLKINYKDLKTDKGIYL